MAVNVSHTPDGRGVLIYNGEMILLYAKTVQMEFGKTNQQVLKGKKTGELYLTSHRLIFTNGNKSENFKSFSMPFHCMKDVKLEQPIFGANYLNGIVVAQPNGNWEGEAGWKLSFNKGGCIDFGQALLKVAAMARGNCMRPEGAPPPYAPPAGAYSSPPPDYYMAPGGQYNGFQAPTHAFPEQPNPGDVYMYDEPPPYPGMAPAGAPAASAPPYPPQQWGTPQPGAGQQPPPPYPAAGPLPAKQ